MIDVSIKAPDVVTMLRRIRTFRADQVPFGLSLAMNRAAKDARDNVRPLMARAFNLRSSTVDKAVGPFGVMREPRIGGKADPNGASMISRGWSHRSQWPNLRVVFGTESHGLARQEVGGIKPNVAPQVWIPTKYVQFTRRKDGTAGNRKLGRHTPSKLRRKMESDARSGTAGGARRGGRRNQYRVFERNGTVFERDGSTGKTLPLYLVRTRAVVRPRMGLEEMIRDTYNAKLWPRFVQAMGKATASEKATNRFTGKL